MLDAGGVRLAGGGARLRRRIAAEHVKYVDGSWFAADAMLAGGEVALRVRGRMEEGQEEEGEEGEGEEQEEGEEEEGEEEERRRRERKERRRKERRETGKTGRKTRRDPSLTAAVTCL